MRQIVFSLLLCAAPVLAQQQQAPAAAASASQRAPAATGSASQAPAASAAGSSTAKAGSAAAKSGGAAPYKVVDGNKVDAATMEGFRTWRSAACDRCHGANQEGMVGPSLIESLKRLSPDDFKNVVLNGRLDKGMPAFKTSEQVTKHIDDLYAYLKGRSDGAITQAKVQPIQ